MNTHSHISDNAAPESEIRTLWDIAKMEILVLAAAPAGVVMGILTAALDVHDHQFVFAAYATVMSCVGGALGYASYRRIRRRLSSVETPQPDQS